MTPRKIWLRVSCGIGALIGTLGMCLYFANTGNDLAANISSVFLALTWVAMLVMIICSAIAPATRFLLLALIGGGGAILILLFLMIHLDAEWEDGKW